MSTIEQQIEALEFEREGYVTFGKKDRVKDVDKQLEYWRGQLEEHGATADAETLTPLQKKQAIGEGVITEAEAAAKGPAVDGEKVSNDRAAAHAAQDLADTDTPVVTEAEVAATDSPEEVEERSNELAAAQAAEDPKDVAEPNVVAEAEVAEVVGLDIDAAPVRPALNATSEEWRAFAGHPDIAIDVPADAGRDQVVAAYIDKFAPTGNASKETWMNYAKDHGVNPEGKSRDEIRVAVTEAGWAAADAAPVAPKKAPQRDAADKTPRQTR